MTLALFLAYLATVAAGFWLNALNLRHLRRYGNTVPAGFEGTIDPETLAKTTAYTLAKSRQDIIESIFDNLLLVIFLFCGVLVVYDRWISGLTGSFIATGVLFFIILTFLQTILSIPFGLYDTFRIENRFGFNTMGPGMWFADLLKSTAVAMLLLAFVTAGGFSIVRLSPEYWWLWVWVFYSAFSVFMMYLSPYVIEPMFNKFEPVQEEGLEDRIRALMARTGIRVSRVMQMDASRRSRHSNAYFTGIGKVKRIVLYDTLIRQMTHDEVLAVLAHEVGHWKKGHVWKRLAVAEAGGLASCYIAYRLIEWGGLSGLLRMEHASFAAQLLILAFLGAIAAFPVTPLFNWLSRRRERVADRFAAGLTGTPDALASALIKLSSENLSNLHPHPLYARFYYSHPQVVERVKVLNAMAETVRDKI